MTTLTERHILSPWQDRFYNPSNSHLLPQEARILKLEGIPKDYSGFNAAPVDQNTYLIRLAANNKETDSFVWAFERKQGDQEIWIPKGDQYQMRGEDAYCTNFIDAKGRRRLSLSVVQVGNHPYYKNASDGFYTAIWELEDLSEMAALEPKNATVLTPLNQKNVRHAQVPGRGSIVAGTRPLGKFEQGGAGVIALTPEVSSLKDLNEPSFYTPEYIVGGIADEIFEDRQTVWVGIDDMEIEGDIIKTLLHLAYKTNADDPYLIPVINGNIRKYDIYYGEINMLKRRLQLLKLICTARELPLTTSRQIPGHHPRDVENIAMSCGMIGNTLSGGLRDAWSFAARIPGVFFGQRLSFQANYQLV